MKGDPEAAVNAYDAFIKEHRAFGNYEGMYGILVNVAEVEHARGNTTRAIVLAREAVAGSRQIAHRVRRSTGLTNLAGYLLAIDDLDAAIEAAREAIDILAARELERVVVAQAIEHLALANALRNEFVRAALCEGYADACLRRAGIQRETMEQGTYDRLMPLLRANLSAGDLSRFLAEGAALAPEAAVARALETSPS